MGSYSGPQVYCRSLVRFCRSGAANGPLCSARPVRGSGGQNSKEPGSVKDALLTEGSQPTKERLTMESHGNGNAGGNGPQIPVTTRTLEPGAERQLFHLPGEAPLLDVLN